MPWIKFTDNFDWSPDPHKRLATVAYKSGMRLLVTTPCAEAAIAAGRGQRCLPATQKTRSRKLKAGEA